MSQKEDPRLLSLRARLLLSSCTFLFALFHVDFTVPPGLSSCVVVLTKTRTSGRSASSGLAARFYSI